MNCPHCGLLLEHSDALCPICQKQYAHLFDCSSCGRPADTHVHGQYICWACKRIRFGREAIDVSPAPRREAGNPARENPETMPPGHRENDPGNSK